MKTKYKLINTALFIFFITSLFIPSYSYCSEPKKEKADISYEEGLFTEINENFADTPKVSDPFILINKAFFYFNDKFYYYILKPAAKGYDYIMPDPFQKSIDNFFNNISAPIRLINCLLQGKFQKGADEFRGFVINSSVGLFGFFNPAKIEASEEDLGQTLAVYGVDNGFYLVLPFLGPTTARDSIGAAADYFLHPFSYIEDTEVALGIRGFERLNYTSLDSEKYERLMRSAIDPYELMKDGYLQIRAEKIKK
ncbi:MAG: VacJ family lipoprotein [Deltaproteobacteria bacterium]|nr:VacJ family lipoprotein [Deltaproteobacteria bacterium]